MNKKYAKVQSTRRSLIMSTISLVLCFAMLLGTTYAWFTDEVTSGVNKIVAGNLDIEVEYSKDGSNWANLQDSPSLFTGALWEPGHTEVVYLRMKNAGTLALKYDLKVSPISETGGINQAGNSFKLSNYIKFATVAADALTTYTRDTARAAVGDGVALNSGMLQSDSMEPKAAGATELPTKYVTLVVYMPESVGDEANYKTGTTAPEIDLGITVLATQLQSEADSFDNTYDKDLTNDTSVIYNYFPQVNVTGQLTILGTEVQKGSTAGNETTVEKLNDTQSRVTLASADQVENNTAAKVEAILEKGTLNDQQTGSMTLKVVKDDTANATFKTDSNKIDTATQDSTTYLVTVETKGVVAVPEATGKAKFKVDLFIGMNRTNVKMYHSGNPMTETDSGAPDTFTYKASTGYVTMYVDSFSPFTAVYDMPVAAIGTTVYYTLQAAVDAAGTEQTTITLLKNVSGDGVDVAADQKIVFDFDGYTYTLQGQMVGSSGTATNGFRFLKGSTVTMKNGKLANGATTAEGNTPAKVMINSYAGLTLKDFSVDATTTAVAPSGSAYGTACLYISNGPATVTGSGTYTGDSDGYVIYMANVEYYTDGAALIFDENFTGKVNGKVTDGNKQAASIQIKNGTYNLDFTPWHDGTVSLTGGTFSSDPTAYVAEGYKAVDNGNGTWTVKLKVAPKPDANGVFTANNDEELADVIEEIKTNNNYWNTPVTIQLGAGIYMGEYHIFQYPTWNGIYYENPNTCDYYLKPGLHVDKDGNAFVEPNSYRYIAFNESEYGVTKSKPYFENAPTTMITIKGTDGVKFDGVIHIWGFGYGVSGDVSFGTDKVYTIIDGIDFEHEGTIDENHNNLVCTGASANVQILNCNFKNTARIIIGKAAMGGGYSYNATVKDCTFKDTDSCIQGYLHGKVGFMFQNVTAENTGSFLNIQNGSGTEPIRMDNVTFTGGTGYFIRQQSGVNVIVTNSTIAFADDAAKGWAVEFRTESTVLLDNCAVTGKKMINSNQSNGTVQLKGTTPTDFEKNSDKITITQVN